MDKFEILIASLPDREHLVAEIYHDNMCWVRISHEHEEFIIQFYPHPRQKYWEFNLEDALEMLEKAKKKLLALDRQRNDPLEKSL